MYARGANPVVHSTRGPMVLSGSRSVTILVHGLMAREASRSWVATGRFRGWTVMARMGAAEDGYCRGLPVTLGRPRYLKARGTTAVEDALELSPRWSRGHGSAQLAPC